MDVIVVLAVMVPSSSTSATVTTEQIRMPVSSNGDPNVLPLFR